MWEGKGGFVQAIPLPQKLGMYTHPTPPPPQPRFTPVLHSI